MSINIVPLVQSCNTTRQEAPQ